MRLNKTGREAFRLGDTETRAGGRKEGHELRLRCFAAVARGRHHSSLSPVPALLRGNPYFVLAIPTLKDLTPPQRFGYSFPRRIVGTSAATKWENFLSRVALLSVSIRVYNFPSRSSFDSRKVAPRLDTPSLAAS